MTLHFGCGSAFKSTAPLAYKVPVLYGESFLGWSGVMSCVPELVGSLEEPERHRAWLCWSYAYIGGTWHKGMFLHFLKELSCAVIHYSYVCINIVRNLYFLDLVCLVPGWYVYLFLERYIASSLRIYLSRIPSLYHRTLLIP